MDLKRAGHDRCLVEHLFGRGHHRLKRGASPITGEHLFSSGERHPNATVFKHKIHQ